ncbi:MAG: acyl transferase [Bacteroidetes bacterium]|nr:acyl transferase [Bacteroidota bacterium]
MYTLKDRIFAVDEFSFETLAIELFAYQYRQVSMYRAFCDSFKKKPENVRTLADIPFIPIDFFKRHRLLAGEMADQKIFESSSTTDTVPSCHYVADLTVYEESFLKGFAQFYGTLQDYIILALLPSYLERETSSLVYMVKQLMEIGRNKESGFYLHDFEKLKSTLEQLKQQNKKVILWGVTFALLDFVEKYATHFPKLIVMETGGMKGRRKEITRLEVHQILRRAFGVDKIHSEYGMTELLSQAYSLGDGRFNTPPWMKILVRDMDDPLGIGIRGSAGALNVVDLANIYSCSFIATGDTGIVYDDGSFEVTGRMDYTEVRGCNLMVH